MSDIYDIDLLCRQCVIVAKDAGKAILEVYNTDFDVEAKDDNSPLTKADLAAHHVIVDALKEITPDIPVLSEESAALPYETRKQWNAYWLVDPLDGTREFVKRNGEFTVNIALIKDNRSIIGVVHVPVKDIDYFAWSGGGSFKSENGKISQIHAKKLSGDKIILAGSRSHGSTEMQSFLNNVGEVDLISMGSSLKLCLVAEGKADLYPRLGLTSEWDTAAAHCIVEQAGGYLTKTDMTPLLYNTKDSLLNPFFFVFGDDSVDWSKYLDNQT